MKFKNKEERDKFVESNMGLVVSIVKKYSFYLDEFEDLVQIGTIGLLKAVDAFDESKGNKFSTFAIYHIRGILLKTYRDEINGKEIYEGDIVEKEIMEPFEESKFIGVVQMIEGCWCVVNDKKLLAKNLWDETDVNSVIGNIYDNPKLLEE